MQAAKRPDEGPPEKTTYTLDEAAKRLGVSTSSIRRAIKRGELRCVRIGRRVLISASTLDRLMNSDGGRD